MRVLNLAGKTENMNIDTKLFETESEKVLFETYQNIVTDYNHALNNFDADGALLQLSHLSNPIHDFFDNNMVMADDDNVRNNRLALVNHIANMIKNYAELTLIEWKQHQ